MLIPLEVNVKQEAWTDFKKVQELLYQNLRYFGECMDDFLKLVFVYR